MDQAAVLIGSTAAPFAKSVSPGDVGSEELSQVGGEWVAFWSVNRLLPLGFRRNSDVF